MKNQAHKFPSPHDIETWVDAWECWKELEQKGELVGEHSPSWWLNKGHDEMLLFCKWLLSEIPKQQGEEKQEGK